MLHQKSTMKYVTVTFASPTKFILQLNDVQVTLFHFEDKPRHGALDVIAELKDRAKLHVIMLTGDHESSAWRVANAVGINEVHCSLKPEDKLNHVTSISRDTGRVSTHHFHGPACIKDRGNSRFSNLCVAKFSLNVIKCGLLVMSGTVLSNVIKLANSSCLDTETRTG